MDTNNTIGAGTRGEGTGNTDMGNDAMTGPAGPRAHEHAGVVIAETGDRGTAESVEPAELGDPADQDVDLRHHGDAEVGPGLVDLAVNVRLAAPPGWLVHRLAASLTDLAAYPDTGRARAAIAARHRRSIAEVLPTAGAA